MTTNSARAAGPLFQLDADTWIDPADVASVEINTDINMSGCSVVVSLKNRRTVTTRFFPAVGQPATTARAKELIDRLVAARA